MVSFDNTAVAFESKSNKDLKRAHLLFSLIGKNWLVATGKRATNFVFSIGLPVKGIIKATIFRQFVGGETIEECERTIAALARYNIGTILDYSVEGLHDESGFAASEAEILRTIRKSSADPRIPFSVFKVSGLAREQVLEKVSSGAALAESETSEWQATSDRVDRLCKAAFEAGKPVLIDAEDSWIQDAIDQLALDMMRKYNREKAIVYNTVQFYRHDRLAYLKAFYEIAEKEGFFAGIKAVRGAYMEKERARAAEKNYSDPIQPDKFSTDRDFDAGVAFCIEKIERISVCAGSHNEDSNLKLVAIVEKTGLPKDHPHIWFAQLLGMSDHISFNLSAEGFNVAKYVPYGPVKEVLPYLMRRAEENTSVAGQTGRELSLIKKELQRRKI